MSSVLRLSMVSLIPLLTELLSSQLEKKHNKGRKQGSKDKKHHSKGKLLFLQALSYLRLPNAKGQLIF